jgi:hypothetical protein
LVRAELGFGRLTPSSPSAATAASHGIADCSSTGSRNQGKKGSTTSQPKETVLLNRPTKKTSVATLAATVVGGAAWVGVAHREARNTSEPPSGLAAYGRTVWNLDALLHNAFPQGQIWLRCRDDSFVAPTPTNATFADFGYYTYAFANARHSQFRLVQRTQPNLGNVRPLRIKGRYISCGPTSWLVLRHGSANLPLHCQPQQ